MRAWVALAAGAVLYTLVAVLSAAALPAEGVPLHFTASGQADRLGTRGAAVTTWAWLGAGMLGLAVLVILVARHGPLRLLNVPHRSYWTAEQREPTLRRMLAADAAAVMGLTLAFLAVIPLWTVLGTRTPDGAVAPHVFWVPVALYLAGLVAWTVWLTRSRYRPRPE